MLARTNEWFRRIHWPPSSSAALGFGLELWDVDPRGYEGYKQLRAHVAALGRRMTSRELAVELSADLLSDVLVAVGGVEQARADFHAAVSRAQVWADEHVPRQPDIPHHIQNEHVTEAWYHFANVLTWMRAVEERLDRSPRRLPRGVPPLRRQGLAPAIAPKRLRKRVEQLLTDLRAGPAGEARLLANRTWHASLIRHSFSGADLDPDGKVLFPVPDRTTAPTYHWQVFTWAEHRDAGSIVEDLWRAVETLFDGVLVEYERATSKRLRRPSALT